MLEYDALVIGAGIAGIQASIDLADQGYKVLMIEKKSSTGGAMIKLSKVFPTLDCSSCITTPKMSEASKHDNITTWTLSEPSVVDKLADGTFNVKIHRKARFVDINKCTGCGECEKACPVYLTNPYDEGLGIGKAIGVPFSNALPQKAVLDPENCIFCGKCAQVCPTDAIDYTEEDQEEEVHVSAIIVATGFEQTPVELKPEYGAGKYKNVITGKQMEILLAPHGPYGGVFRPGDGKNPYSIAYIQCAGSRDASIGIPYCSRVCCMYAIKQAMLLSAAAPLAEITIYYMDIRAFSRRYEEFFRDAESMGIHFIKGKVAQITEMPSGDLQLRVEVQEEEDYGVKEIEHDLVVLSLGMVPAWNPEGVLPIEIRQDGFIKRLKPKLEPALTTVSGIYVAGTANGPMDIVDSINQASAAAMKSSIYIEQLKGGSQQEKEPEEVHISEQN
ncbi:MAG: 4Fe-4S dicluster domain-containing protein [Candidatus Heimdallarchaeaceae archaeon]